MDYENQNDNILIENMTGSGSDYPVPDIVAKRFNWGAFCLDWIWGLGNKSYITLISLPLWILCCIPGFKILPYTLSLMISIWFGIKGNEWAWQNKHFNNIEDFHNNQKKWAIAGVIYMIFCATIPLIIAGFVAALTFPVLMTDTTAKMEASMARKSAVVIKEVTLINESYEEKCQLTSEGIATCFAERMSGDRNNNVINALDGTVWTFEGNGVCENNGDCKVTVKNTTREDKDILTVPLYINTKGYIYAKEEDLADYLNR